MTPQPTDPPRGSSSEPDGEVPADTPHAARPAGLLRRLGRWLERDHLPDWRDLRVLYTAPLKDGAANRLAAAWSARYLAATADERRALLASLVRAAVDLEAPDEPEINLFRRLYAQADSLGLMVDLRADIVRWRNQVAGLARLEKPLATLLAHWFDVGMLELRPINWDSPASLLEKLIQYEAVHAIRSWNDMKRRVAADRRCYAFFHPRMNDVPLIFVEVAFAEQVVANVQDLLDPERPVEGLEKARWAIFYSISNTQAGLRGISFGNFLLERVIKELLAELPALRNFATLSPIPGFANWLEKQKDGDIRAMLARRPDQRATAGDDDASGAAWVARLRTEAAGTASDATRRSGLRLASHYLRSLQGERPLDPVARFHLGNGARIEHLNWAADLSANGLSQSCGMMVNYLYELDQLDENRARLEAGKPRTSLGVQWL